MKNFSLRILLLFVSVSLVSFNHKIPNDMSDFTIEKFTLSSPKYFAGKFFSGSYNHTSEYLDQVKSQLLKASISFDELAAVSIYLSDPAVTKETELMSYHGFVVDSGKPVQGFELKEMPPGQYLKAFSKDADQIWASFGATYQFAAENNIALAEDAPVLITTVENQAPLFSLYFRTQ